MYTVVISVPFRRVAADVCEVPSDWGAALRLLRDSLRGRFGPVVVAAPEEPGEAGERIADQVPLALHERDDAIQFVRLGSSTWGAWQFWRNWRSVRRTLDDLASRSEVMHTGINHLYLPHAPMGFFAGERAGTMSVFVLDTDIVMQLEQMTRGTRLRKRAWTWVYKALYARTARRAIAAADLVLLKGRQLHERYGALNPRAKDFYNTSYGAADVIAADALAAKCAEVLGGAPLRALSIGRLIPRKGVDHTVRAVAAAVARGVPLVLDVVGGGPEEPALRKLAHELGVAGAVNFCGSVPYDAALLRRVATYHLWLFTPLSEDTPRAMFDAMAGGCALLAYDVPFARQVLADARQAPPVPLGGPAGLADLVVRLNDSRERVAELMSNCAQEAPHHTAESWYARRAAWTEAAYLAKFGRLPEIPTTDAPPDIAAPTAADAA
jgi:glycosyltransferase involved in cell wall biosynthesis